MKTPTIYSCGSPEHVGLIWFSTAPMLPAFSVRDFGNLRYWPKPAPGHRQAVWVDNDHGGPSGPDETDDFCVWDLGELLNWLVTGARP